MSSDIDITPRLSFAAGSFIYIAPSDLCRRSDNIVRCCAFAARGLLILAAGIVFT